jgi:hypothetical protein
VSNRDIGPACVYEFRRTSEYVYRALQRDSRGKRRPSWLIRWVCSPLLLVFSAGVFAMAVSDWIKTGRLEMRSALGGLFMAGVAVAVGWPGVLGGPLRWFASRQKSGPHDDRDMRVSLAAVGVDIDDGISRTASKWDCYSRARFLADGILLESGPHSVLWLPDTALVQSRRADAEDLVRAHVAKCE